MVRLPLSPDELERGRRLGALLRSARDDRSILDVALAAGISPETLRKIETGRIATPSFASIAAVAGVVGMSLDTLWAEVHPPSPTGSTDGGPSGVGPSGARVGAVRG